MTRADMKILAKQNLTGNYGVAILAVLLVAILSAVMGFIPIVGWIAGIVLAGPLNVGAVRVFNRMARGERPEVADAFFGFQNNFTANCVAGIVFTLIMFGCGLLCIILIGIPLMIYVGMGFAMVYYVLEDNPNLDGVGALRESWALMNGHRVELFVLGLSFFGWVMLIGVTFGLAAFYVGPYMSETFSVFYYNLKGQYVRNDDAPTPPPYDDIPPKGGSAIDMDSFRADIDRHVSKAVDAMGDVAGQVVTAAKDTVNQVQDAYQRSQAADAPFTAESAEDVQPIDIAPTAPSDEIHDFFGATPQAPDVVQDANDVLSDVDNMISDMDSRL